MKKILYLSLMLLGFQISFGQQSQVPGAYVPGEILIKVDDPASLAEIETGMQLVNNQYTGLRVSKVVSAPVNIWLLVFDENAISHDQMISALYSNKHVLVAQNNHYVQERLTPNDPSFGSQWHHVDGSDNDIDSDLAWDVTTGGTTQNGDEIVVCVIEGGGADWAHPDLAANHWVNTAEIANNSIDDDGNGYVDDYDGWNSGNNTDNIATGSHGTQVTGMIGAVGDNANNVVGANWNVKIMQVDMSGTLSEANVIAAYTYPLTMRELYTSSGGTQGAFVVATNASWGIDNANPADYPLWCDFYNTLGQAGILNCGATANNNVNIDVVGDMPTACSSPYMISVTATNSSDVRTFSGYGQTTIDLGSPGASVVTTSAGGGSGSTSGTSFASPLTAGVIALLYSVPCQNLADLAMSDPQGAADQIRTALLDGVDPVSNLTTETVTGGRLNANNSVQLILTGCGIPTCDMVLNSSATDASCNSVCDGEITVTPTGGSGSYTFDIGAGPQPSGTFTGLCDGSYSIVINDGALCNETVNVTVNSPSPMGGGTALTHEYFGNDGAVNLSVSGGTAPYSFSWTGPGGFAATTEDISGLAGGVYEVTITDANGCEFVISNITIMSFVGVNEQTLEYSIYPNPAQKEFTLVLPGSETVTIQLHNALGNIVLTQTAAKTTTIGVSGLAKGLYLYTITSQSGLISTGRLVIE
ncbi:MAG: T9SS type A sorting domain-containing protein [Bacteroidetes bacterium]|nr:T9SS type A sorting domain-containing protein [Bacteroidota bacterium]